MESKIYDIAIVSQLKRVQVIDSIFEVAKIHNTIIHCVHNVTDDAELLFGAEIPNILNDIFQDNYKGTDLSTLGAGEVASIRISRDDVSVVEVYVAIPVEIGWVRSSVTLDIVLIGTIFYTSVAVVLPQMKLKLAEQERICELLKLEHKNKLEIYSVELQEVLIHQKATATREKNELMERVKILHADISTRETKIELLEYNNDLLKSRNESLEKSLEKEKETTRNRINEYKRLALENISLRESDNINSEMIIKLNNEIGTLRAREPRGSEKSSLYPTTRADKKEKKIIPDMSYDACVDQIKMFNRQTLLSKEKRDKQRAEFMSRRNYGKVINKEYE